MELVLFFLLAVVTNTAVSPPFDPVLVWFAHGRDALARAALVAVGCVGAGVAAAVETTVLDWWHRSRGTDRPGGTEPAPRGFYLLAAAVAASPLPFMTVRLAALRCRPRPLLFALAVALGRAPRYALTISLASLVAWPAAVVGALAVGAAAAAAWRMFAMRPAARAVPAT